MVARYVVAALFTVPTEASMVPTTVGARRSMKGAAETLLRAQTAVAARENFILRDYLQELLLVSVVCSEGVLAASW